MAVLFLLGMWVLYFCLARTCLRMSTAVIKAGDRNVEARLRRPRVQIPDTVPSEWVETYRAEKDA